MDLNIGEPHFKNRLRDIFTRINYLKFSVAVLLTWYYAQFATSDPLHIYANWNVIDSIDLIIHEGGHVIFSFFGQFIYILGGSLTQVVLPCIFAGYFFFKRQYFSGSILLFWVAQNVLYVATYMGDAIVEQLQLLGGNDAIHDWNYLFTHMGVLQYTDQISSFTRFIGFYIIICASVLCFRFSIEPISNSKKSLD